MPKSKPPLWRHGDVFIQQSKGVPKRAKKLPHRILARGEATGHAHRVAEAEGVTLYSWNTDLHLQISGESGTVVHQEHGPISLPTGTYRVWIQREYSPEAIRRVID